MAKNSKSLNAVSTDDDWSARRDLDTLVEASKIEADPKRLAKARALAKGQMMSMAKVAADTND